MLRRAQQALEAPVDQSDVYQDTNARWQPGPVHLLKGLIKLEPQVRESLPDLAPALTQAREKLFVSLSVETQKLFQQVGTEISTEKDQTFAERIEPAKAELDADEHDQLIASAVLGSEKEKQADVTEAIDQITDLKLRAHLLEWFYFHRAATAIKGKQFDEAERRGRGGRYQGEYLMLFYMPGLDPESAFREMAKLDFDNAFSLSSTLSDKPQRAMSTLAIAETCLARRLHR